MDLETRERLQLAAFFAKRWPTAEHRIGFATRARIAYEEPVDTEPEAGWDGLIAAAVAGGALAGLARVTAASAPGDENLQQLCSVLSPREHRPVLLGIALGGGGGVLAVAALVLFAVIASPTSKPDVAPASATVAATPIAPAVSAPAPASEVAPTAPDVLARTAPAPDPARPAPTGQEQARPAPPQAEPTSGGWTAEQENRDHRGRCVPGDDGVIGYWYAGSEPPGSAGDIIEVPYMVNVRADYPDSHNGFDARASIRCTLARGERIRLSQPPIEVPGDAYWVPLVASDLVDQDGTAEL